MKKLASALGCLRRSSASRSGLRPQTYLTLDQAGAKKVMQAARGERGRSGMRTAAVAVVDHRRRSACFPADGWVSDRQAWTSLSRRRERPRGCNGRRRRSKTKLLGPNGIRHCRHRSTALRRADTCKRPSRGCGRCCQLSKETDTAIANRGGDAEPSPITTQPR